MAETCCEFLDDIAEIVERCSDALAGQLPAIQGAALCQLVAMHIGGLRAKNPSDQAGIDQDLLALHVATVSNILANSRKGQMQ